ncbi:hypothetical protein AB0A74_01625 [Saccharothrix sp. NPDC042600]|uniref:hypothetical protein n=1 Tax=Saccharothrix TaxID=2071 RepID=UPI0033DC70B2|nr:hypothetical protein GCM10017745_50410 [Saccharothrix mutabilis subsp. capreolus]
MGTARDDRTPPAPQREPVLRVRPAAAGLLALQRGAGNAATCAAVRRMPVVQRAIGLEIEVPIPVDQLTGGDVAQLAAYEAAVPPNRAVALGYAQTNGWMNYGAVVRPPAAGFHVEADHDDRVVSRPPFQQPLAEGGADTILEIVTDANAANTVAQFRQTIQAVRAWIAAVEAATAGMTTRAAPPGGPANVHIGPMTYGAPLAARRPQHNWLGSVQVNVGIDLREYHSMMKWYANSRFARASRAAPAHQQIYRDIKAHLRLAVDVGRAVTADIIAGNLPAVGGAAPAPLPAHVVQQTGNLRGIRGWMTHMALYLARANAAGMGGSRKNLAPMLMKTPPAVATHYGLTAAEIAVFNARSTEILEHILALVGRPVAVPGTGPATPVFGAHAVGGNDVATAPWTAVAPTGAHLINLAGGVVPLAGTPLLGATGVGPARTGAHLGGLPAPAPGVVGGLHAPAGPPPVVGAGARGGLVTEIRTLPGYYRPDEWEALGVAFFRAAKRRNKRPGV